MILINKIMQTTTINCESCEDLFKTFTPSLAQERCIPWRLAVDEMRKLGWKMELNNDGTEWLTFCKSCLL